VREAKDLARSAGVARVITKPFNPQDIIVAVDEVLDAERAPTEHAPEEKDYQRKHLRLVTNKLSETVDGLRTANERLRALVDLNLRLVSLRDPPQLLDEACRGARELLGARHGVLAVRDRTNGDMPRYFTSGFTADVASTFTSTGLDAGELGAVVAERRTLRLMFSRNRRMLGLPRGYPTVRSLIAAPIASLSAVYGWICLTDKIGSDAFSDDDETLLSLVAALGGRGYENGNSFRRMRRQAAAQVQSLSRRLVQVQESERRRLARELHDRVGQNLTALSINLDLLRAQGAAERPAVRARLDDSVALVGATAEAIENVMADLRPPVLEAEGLLPALRWHTQGFTQRTGIDVTVRGEQPEQRPGHEVEITLFRIALEALNNVAKHARATHVELTLDQAPAECSLTLTDNGVGFDPQAAHLGRGLAAMRERSESIGARFEATSLAGEGTRIAVSVPRLDPAPLQEAWYSPKP
jgi:signal transduction histidine kinase